MILVLSTTGFSILFHIMDLTEEGVTEADRHRLSLSVVGKRSLSKLTSNTGLLVTTERNLVVKHVVAVNPNSSGTDTVGDLDGSVEVVGVDSSRKTVGRVVTSLNSLLNSLELGDRADWAENLLLHNLHVLGNTREDSWLDEVSLVSETLASDLDLGALALSGLNVLHHAIELDLRDLWALEGLWVERISDLVCGGALTEAGNELIVDALLDIDAGAGAAGLAVVEVDTEVDP